MVRPTRITTNASLDSMASAERRATDAEWAEPELSRVDQKRCAMPFQPGLVDMGRPMQRAHCRSLAVSIPFARCSPGICQIFEQKLKSENPLTKKITSARTHAA
jgi:hypothetical protein